MKRIIAVSTVLAVMLSVMFSMGGCFFVSKNAPESTTSAQVSTEATEQTETQTEAKTETEPNTTEEPVSEGITVESAFFTMTLPDSWEGKYYLEETDGDDGEYTMVFYEKNCHETVDIYWCPGHVFTIIVCKAHDENHPMLQVLNKISVSGKTYEVCLASPTDVQFYELYQDDYFLLYNGVDDVVSTITYKNNVSVIG